MGRSAAGARPGSLGRSSRPGTRVGAAEMPSSQSSSHSPHAHVRRELHTRFFTSVCPRGSRRPEEGGRAAGPRAGVPTNQGCVRPLVWRPQVPRTWLENRIFTFPTADSQALTPNTAVESQRQRADWQVKSFRRFFHTGVGPQPKPPPCSRVSCIGPFAARERLRGAQQSRPLPPLLTPTFLTFRCLI